MNTNFYIAILLLGVICLGLIIMVNFWQFGGMKRFLTWLKSLFQSQQAEIVEESEPLERSAVTTATSDIDELTEAIIDISFGNPVKGEKILQYILTHQGLNVRIGSKPIRYFVHTVAGDIHKFIEYDWFYQRLQIAMTVFNRSGAINDIEWSEVCRLANQIADLSEGTTEPQPELPNFEKIKEKAAQIEQQCAVIDTTVSLHIVFKTPVSDEKVAQIAMQQGFVKYQNIMVWCDDEGQVRFYLFFCVDEENAHQVVRLQCYLDVPRVLAQANAFSNMLKVAQSLAKSFDVDVLDNQGKVVSMSTAELIDQQLDERYQLLEEHGFSPGSERALRIFSR